MIQIFKHVYPNLVGQMKAHGDTYSDIARLLDNDRTTVIRKMRNGKFSVLEAKALARRYSKTLEYLFYVEDAYNAELQVHEVGDRAVQTAENADRDSKSAQNEQGNPE